MRVLSSRSVLRSFEEARFAVAWRRAGGAAEELRWLDHGTAPARLAEGLEAVSGLLLTGGPDVEPWRYGAAPDEAAGLHCDPDRDRLDLGLLALAERHGWPVLAVCYGMQLLVVAEGGALVQDLTAAGLPGHAISEPKDHLAHDVIVEATSRWLPHGRFSVNSRHHQAACRVAGRLCVVGAAPDGVVEAVEGVGDARFLLGVQWHPENLASEPHTGLFATFRQACLRRG